jgi:transcriptional regulator with XRE-family HTH domain
MQHQRTSPRALSPEHVYLGRAVRVRRASQWISQEELGFRALLHRNYIGAIERGEINPTFRTLLKLAEGLGVAIPELMVLYVSMAARGGA